MVREKISDRFCYKKLPGLLFDSKDPKSVSRTQQQFKKECDINNIMSKFIKTGVIAVRLGVPVFGDFSSIGSYHEAIIKLKEADLAFSNLPSKIRERFENSPEKFIAFMSDEKNTEEAIKLGLAAAPAPVASGVAAAAPVPAVPGSGSAVA